MRISLHIGPDAASADRIARILADKREQLAGRGVLFARAPGARNHTRLFMACSDPARVDSLRFNRGFTDPAKQAQLYADLARDLAAEVRRHSPDHLILCAHQLGSTLATPSELARLRALLAPLSSDIRVIAHVEAPERMLLRRYHAQLLEGRARPLSLELEALGAGDLRAALLASQPTPDPQAGLFPEVQGGCFWLDLAGLEAAWRGVFGHFAFHGIEPALFGPEGTQAVARAFDLPGPLGRAEAEAQPAAPSAAWQSRCRLFNEALLRLLARRESVLPRQLWRKMLGELKVGGAPIPPGSLSALSQRFAKDIAALCAAHPGLAPGAMAPPAPAAPWREADPTMGFRATQYLAAFRWRITQATKEHLAERAEDLARLEAAQAQLPGHAEAAQSPALAMAAGPVLAPRPAAPPAADVEALLSPGARRLLPPLAKQNFARLQGSRFAPHNRLGRVAETEAAAPYTEAAPQPRPEGSSGNVILACMKNEGPYILEWLAYHRAVGFDDFLIYTNGCEDGTDEILARAQALGLVQHRDNNHWTGKSPQTFALESALTEPIIEKARWIAHIDVDEFVNIRCGNGTLADVFAAVPDATNIAMTWRLFGHNGVTRFEDRPVIEQFEACAPSFCPKPHTAWGFKTLFRNIGAYGRISCHRPNKLAPESEPRVKWVNGSGQDMTREALRNGWRNSKRSIGYDMVQLNHYALRSAESFLVKRQRGRALHVDRSIGLNYWIRMDWSGQRDVTIQRNLPRLRAGMARLLADPVLARWHAHACDWHRAKAEDLRAQPEFAALYDQALALKLTETERVAYALALDMES